MCAKWGHDFRADYLKLDVVKKLCPGICVMALTATATPTVRKDIEAQLGLRAPVLVQMPTFRANLVYDVVFKDCLPSNMSVLDDMADFIRNLPVAGPLCGIVYAHKRDTCNEVAANLALRGLAARAYHSGLKPKSVTLQFNISLSGKLTLMIEKEGGGGGGGKKKKGGCCCCC